MDYSADELQKMMDNNKHLDWYHRFEVYPGTGIYTPGKTDATDYSNRLKFFEVEKDFFKRKRILDIGAYSGSWAFLLEEYGADVVALDVYDPNMNGFNLIKEIRKSKVEHRQMSVYEISPDTLGYFDIVCFFGVFYHLRHPLLALEKIYTVLNKNALLLGGGTTCQEWFHNRDTSCLKGVNFHAITKENFSGREEDFTIDTLNGLPIACYTDKQFLMDRSNWFIPNQLCLSLWLEDSGFSVGKIRTFTSLIGKQWLTNDKPQDITRSSTIFKAIKTHNIRVEYNNQNMLPYVTP